MALPRFLLLFDIDGTLLYTGGAGRMAFDRAFECALGLKGAWGSTKADGKTDPLLIQEMARRGLGRELSAAENQKVAELYQQYFEEEIQRSERFCIMPGVPLLLETLARDPRFLLGLATGNYKRTAYLKLERAGLDKFFKFGGFGCDSPERSELVRVAIERGGRIRGKAFEPEEVTVIGDTVQDIHSGKKQGTRTLGVLTGRTLAEDFFRSGADEVLPDFSQPGKLLDLYGE